MAKKTKLGLVISEIKIKTKTKASLETMVIIEWQRKLVVLRKIRRLQKEVVSEEAVCQQALVTSKNRFALVQILLRGG